LKNTSSESLSAERGSSVGVDAGRTDGVEVGDELGAKILLGQSGEGVAASESRPESGGMIFTFASVNERLTSVSENAGGLAADVKIN
jgi:hypothetical protein